MAIRKYILLIFCTILAGLCYARPEPPAECLEFIESRCGNPPDPSCFQNNIADAPAQCRPPGGPGHFLEALCQDAVASCEGIEPGPDRLDCLEEHTALTKCKERIEEIKGPPPRD